VLASGDGDLRILDGLTRLEPWRKMVSRCSPDSTRRARNPG
jgi:hypothetical protein